MAIERERCREAICKSCYKLIKLVNRYRLINVFIIFINFIILIYVLSVSVCVRLFPFPPLFLF